MYCPVLELSEIIQTINQGKGGLILTHLLQFCANNNIGYTLPTLAQKVGSLTL